MWEISDIKAKGRTAFKANYWPSVAAAAVLSIATAGSSYAGASRTNTAELSNSYNSMTSEEQMILVGAIIVGVLIALVIGLVIKIFVSNPLEVGCKFFFKCNIVNPRVGFGVVSEGFKNFGHTFVTLFLRDLFTLLWALLLIIPGIIKAYSYRMVPYILQENPNMPSTQILKMSEDMMRGNKGRAFLMDLTFIGWILLTIITCGILGIFWTGPYMSSTDAALYLELKRQ